PASSVTGSEQVLPSADQVDLAPSGIAGNCGPPPVQDMPSPICILKVTLRTFVAGSTSRAPLAGESVTIFGTCRRACPSGVAPAVTKQIALGAAGAPSLLLKLWKPEELMPAR